MSKVEVRFEGWIKEGWELYKNNIGLLILAGLLTIVISGVSFGICAGPMMVGFALICLRLRDKSSPPPQVGDLFNGFSYFLPSFLLVLVIFVASMAVNIVLAFLPGLGSLVQIAGSTLIMFSVWLIADRKMDFWPSITTSYEKVITNFWPFLGFNIVASLISMCGLILCGVGAIVTFPIMGCMLSVAYRDVFDGAGEAPADAPAVEAAPVDPPPPAPSEAPPAAPPAEDPPAPPPADETKPEGS